MNEQIQVIASLAAFGVLTFFGGLAAWAMRAQQVGRLRRHVAAHVDSMVPGAPQLLKRAPEATAIPFNLNKKIGQSSMGKRLELELTRAGLTITPNQLITGQVTLAALLFLVGRLFLFESHGHLAILLSLGVALPALIFPRFVIQHLRNRRVSKFELQLASGVDMMSGALQAGSSLPQSFEIVSREMPPPIGEEFGRLMQEARVGVPLDQALENMRERVPSMDLEMLVTAINIQYRVGGNLSHILKTIAHTIRERVRIKGELSTLTAQARLSSYIISGMPVVVVAALFVISPTYIVKLFDPGITRIMLVSGIMGIITGFYVMKRIAAIEV